MSAYDKNLYTIVFESIHFLTINVHFIHAFYLCMHSRYTCVHIHNYLYTSYILVYNFIFKVYIS